MADKINIEITDSNGDVQLQFIKGTKLRCTASTTTNEKAIVSNEQHVFIADDGSGYTITIEKSHSRKI